MTAETEPTLATDQAEQSRRIPWWAVPITILFVIAVVIGAFLYYGYRTTPGWVGVSDKKFWDYLDLLIVPAALAVGVYLLNRSQSEREGEAEEARKERELEVENQRAQDAVLRAYVDTMSELLTDKELPKKEGTYEPTRVTARAQTLVAVAQLDGERKRSIVQFLYEAHLINVENKPPDYATEFNPRLVGLSGADLKKANLRYLILEYAAFDGANLENADLRDTWLRNSDLGGSYLSGANLRGANLSGASLKNAHLQRKDELNLNGTDLTDADLTGADLTGAELSGAVVTSGQLQSARSLQGATLPDGTVHD
jgi:Pentapeptide repeats (8 copies)